MEVKRRLEYVVTGVPHFGTLEFSGVPDSRGDLCDKMDSFRKLGGQVQTLAHALVADVAFGMTTDLVNTSTLCLTYFRDGFKHGFVDIDSSVESSRFLRSCQPHYDKNAHYVAVFDYLVSCAETSGRVVPAIFESDGVKIGDPITRHELKIRKYDERFVFEGKFVSAAIGNREVLEFYAKHLKEQGIDSVAFELPHYSYNTKGDDKVINRDIRRVSSVGFRGDGWRSILCDERQFGLIYRAVNCSKTQFASPKNVLLPKPQSQPQTANI